MSGSDRRESRHHLFIECRAWAPQTQRLWERVVKDCRLEHPKAPAVRKLRKEGVTEAMLEYLEDTRVGCWSPSGARRAPREAEDLGEAEEGEEGGPGQP